MSDTPIYDALVQELGSPFKRKHSRPAKQASTKATKSEK